MFTRNLVNMEWNSKKTWNFFIGMYHYLSTDMDNLMAEETREQGNQFLFQILISLMTSIPLHWLSQF